METKKQNKPENPPRGVIHEDPIPKDSSASFFDFKHLATYLLFAISMTAVVWTTYRSVAISAGGSNNHPVSVGKTPRVLAPGQDLTVKTYSNAKYAYEFKYPKDGILEIDSAGNLRIQNYETSNAATILEDGQFSLVMKVAPSTTTCVGDGSKLVTNTPSYSIYRGTGAGDNGGLKFILCASKSSQFYKISVTEKDIAGAIANQIFSSYKFIDPNAFNPAK